MIDCVLNRLEFCKASLSELILEFLCCNLNSLHKALSYAFTLDTDDSLVEVSFDVRIYIDVPLFEFLEQIFHYAWRMHHCFELILVESLMELVHRSAQLKALDEGSAEIKVTSDLSFDELFQLSVLLRLVNQSLESWPIFADDFGSPLAELGYSGYGVDVLDHVEHVLKDFLKETVEVRLRGCKDKRGLVKSNVCE